MKTPAFWQKKGWQHRALSPFSALYQWGYNIRRLWVKPAPASARILCIGNLTLGGSGKTPVALALGERISTRFPNACYLTKGYKGKLHGPVLVSAQHTAEDVGDEPLLLMRTLPTIMAKNRRQGLAFAEARGFTHIVMDDGFQNPHITPHVSLVVIDSGFAFGNGLTFPAGPLREPVETGLARAQGIILLHRGGQCPLPFTTHLPVVEATLETQVDAPSATRVVAFAGLGRPQQFFDALKHHVQVVEACAFADHHLFTEAELQHLLALAAKHHAQLITTAKDAARLPEHFRHQVIVAKAELVWHNAALLDGLLAPLEREETP